MSHGNSLPRLAILLPALLGFSPRAEAGVTIVHLSPLDLAEARIQGLKRLPFERGLLEGTGTLESPVIETAFAFDDLVGSWNADIAERGWLEMQVQVRAAGAWTPWYRLSRWENGAGSSLGRQEDKQGYVDVDTLKLRDKADAFRYRIRMKSAGARKTRLLRVAVTYEDMSVPARSSPPFEAGPWVRELKVPPRSQMEEQEKYKHDICSPTSLAMALEFWGVKKETIDVARTVQDHEGGLYGNWPLNVAAASKFGLAGQVARLSSLADLQSEIAAGRPVVVSVSFSEGQLNGAPIRKTRGHLMVVTGFTALGDVIANDPAASSISSVRRVYARAQFEKVWLGNKHGLAYLLSKRFPEDLAVGTPTADLRANARFPPRKSASDSDLSSQLLYGETVRVLEARGDWARVCALEQPGQGEREGYPGWTRIENLRKAPLPYHPDMVVRAKRADVFFRDAAGKEQTIALPIGSLLTSAVGSSAGTVFMLDGRLARVSSGALRSLYKHFTKQDIDGTRRDILEAAALFLGDRYVWGGRSSQQRQAGWGVDCSGLVQLAYRSVGITLPRDAHAQYLSARALGRERLKPADLVFLSDPEDAQRVNHVLLYTGGDGLIESRESAEKTLRTTFQERFGAGLPSLRSGEWVTDLTRAKPVKRRIFFGSFLPR